MIMEETVDEMLDYENILCLRNQLVNVPIEVLLEKYSGRDEYLLFVDAVAALCQKDSAFLLFDEMFIEKIEKVIVAYRLEYKDTPNLTKVVNEIIVYLNEIKGYSVSMQNSLKEHYLDWNEDVRDISFKEEEGFIDALAYDAVAFMALKEGNMELIQADALFMASVNYFVATCPEFFDNPLVKERAINKLIELSKKELFFNSNREYAKDTIKAVQKIKKGE